MGMVELALSVKAGKVKLKDVPEGRRKNVARLLDVVEPRAKAAPIHSRATFYARPKAARS